MGEELEVAGCMLYGKEGKMEVWICQIATVRKPEGVIWVELKFEAEGI